MVSYANCCHPIPGDAIEGYLSSEKGMVVHRETCNNLADMRDHRDRLVALRWDGEVEGGVVPPLNPNAFLFTQSTWEFVGHFLFLYRIWVFICCLNYFSIYQTQENQTIQNKTQRTFFPNQFCKFVQGQSSSSKSGSSSFEEGRRTGTRNLLGGAPLCAGAMAVLYDHPSVRLGSRNG